MSSNPKRPVTATFVAPPPPKPPRPVHHGPDDLTHPVKPVIGPPETNDSMGKS